MRKSSQSNERVVYWFIRGIEKTNSPWNIIIKTLYVHNKGMILKSAGWKKVTYKDRPNTITLEFSVETQKARTSGMDVLETLKDNRVQSSALYPAKLLITMTEKENHYMIKNKFKTKFYLPIQLYNRH